MSSAVKSPFEEPIFNPDAGFFLAQRNQVLSNGRYKIIRKIGRGRDSSTWLVLDNSVVDNSAIDNSRPPIKYHALKILTTRATTLHKNGTINELEFLKIVTTFNHLHFHLPRLLDHFEHVGPYGLHLCFVLELLGETVSTFRRRCPPHEVSIPIPEKPLPGPSLSLLPRWSGWITDKIVATMPGFSHSGRIARSLPGHLVRKIITQILDALGALHDASIIHTDIKQDNFIFELGNDRISDAVINQDVLTAGVFLHEDTEYPIFRTQPLPYHVSVDDPILEVERWNTYLIDLGRAQKVVDKPPTRKISAYALRSPEVLLKVPYSTKVDIWALGCTTFELLTGTWLFDPQSSDGAGTEDDSGDEGFDDEMDNAASGGELGARSSDGPWSRKDDHLAKMLQITGEVFPSNMISSTPLRRKYFDASGNLRRRKQLPSVTIEDLLRQHGVESQGAADFIRECLHLDPDQRKSAHELASHPWMANAEWCGPELP